MHPVDESPFTVLVLHGGRTIFCILAFVLKSLVFGEVLEKSLIPLSGLGKSLIDENFRYREFVHELEKIKC